MIMKAIQKILLLGVLSCSMTVSCSDFLDKYPNKMNTESHYKTDEQAEQAANAIYSVFYNFFQNHVGFDVDCLSDDIVKGHGTDFSDYNSFNTGQMQASNPAIRSLYGDYYTGIFRANMVLDNVPGQPKVSQKMKDMVLGESHFLRAWFYYQLVQRYGGVPLLLTTVNQPKSPARSTAEAVYGQIEKDLRLAADMLPDAGEAVVGRPNHGSAVCLLGLVQLSQNKYSDCYNTLKPVVTNENGRYGYRLVENLADMYQIANNNGPESVFEVQAREAAPLGQTMAFNHWIRPRGMSKLGGLGFMMPTQSLYDEFEKGDKRLEATILKEGDFIASELVDDSGAPILFKGEWAPETGMSAAKYVKWVNVGSYQERSGQNKKLIRYAEVLLAYAEAAYHSGDVQQGWWALNEVRARAFEGEPSRYDNDFMVSLRHERRVELALENHRYFDLVRWGMAEQVLVSDCKKHTNFNLPYVYNKEAAGLYPLPECELHVNKNPGFFQNPGY